MPVDQERSFREFVNAKLTQKSMQKVRLAEELGVNQNSLRSWISAGAFPSILVSRLAELLGVGAEVLLATDLKQLSGNTRSPTLYVFGHSVRMPMTKIEIDVLPLARSVIECQLALLTMGEFIHLAQLQDKLGFVPTPRIIEEVLSKKRSGGKSVKK